MRFPNYFESKYIYFCRGKNSNMLHFAIFISTEREESRKSTILLKINAT